jgi:hypothetical protein
LPIDKILLGRAAPSMRRLPAFDEAFDEAMAASQLAFIALRS